MAYAITYTPEASLDLSELPKRDDAFVRNSGGRYLTVEPLLPSHKRKELGPNPLSATWELRLGELRVYYDVDATVRRVRVLRVGRKLRERVYLRGVMTDLRG